MSKITSEGINALYLDGTKIEHDDELAITLADGKTIVNGKVVRAGDGRVYLNDTSFGLEVGMEAERMPVAAIAAPAAVPQPAPNEGEKTDGASGEKTPGS